MSTAALIFAAGGSRRLGRPKQLEPWGETNLLSHVVANTRLFGADEMWIVLGADIDRIIEETDLEDVGIIENPEWKEGLASSLRVGLDALTRLSRSDQALLVIGDQPEISIDVVNELMASHSKAGYPVTVPKYRYSYGNPAVVDKSIWPRIMSLEGDEGARRLFQAHPEWVNEVWFSELGPRDIDTETDVIEMRPKHPA